MAETLAAIPTAAMAFFRPESALVIAAEERDTLLCMSRMDLEAFLAWVVMALKSAPARIIKFLTTWAMSGLLSSEQPVPGQHLFIKLIVAHFALLALLVRE